MATNTVLQWTRIAPSDASAAPVARSGHSCVVYENAAYVFGGLGKHCYNDLWRFDFAQGSIEIPFVGMQAQCLCLREDDVRIRRMEFLR